MARSKTPTNSPETSSTKHRAVYVAIPALEKIKPYQDLFGTPTGKIMEEALEEWWQCIALPRLESAQAIAAGRRSNVIVMPAASEISANPAKDFAVASKAVAVERHTD